MTTTTTTTEVAVVEPDFSDPESRKAACLRPEGQSVAPERPAELSFWRARRRPKIEAEPVVRIASVGGGGLATRARGADLRRHDLVGSRPLSIPLQKKISSYKLSP